MIAWIRFIITAVLMIGALGCFVSAVTGVWRFGFVLNRVHAAGIGDSLGILLMMAALAVGSGLNMTSLKLLLLVVLLWLTSPVSSHFLSQIEYYTNPDLYEHVTREESMDPERKHTAKKKPDEGRTKSGNDARRQKRR